MGIINIYAPWLDSASKMCDIDDNINVEIFIDQMPTTKISEGWIRIIKILEPFDDLKKKMFRYLRDCPDKYSFILTYHQDILDEFKNSMLSVTPTTWIPYGYEFNEKIFGVSSLVGNKHASPFSPKLDGYLTRWEVHKLNNNIKIPTRFYLSSHSLVDGVDYEKSLILKESKNPLFDTQFHIAIENTNKIKNAFSEKIIDCFQTKTVPVYYGPSNIGDFFNMSGIIYCESTQDIINKCNLLTPDVYHSMRDAIEDNYNRSMEYSSFNKSIIDQSKKIIKQI